MGIHVSQGENLAKKLAKTVRGGEVFALVGELGSGKTTFTRHLGKALGIKNPITSPTFVIMQEHQVPAGKGRKQKLFLYHLDLYRASSPKDISSLGLEQIWNHPQAVTVIEWADKIKKFLPPHATFIYFDPNEKNPPAKTK